LCTALCLGGTTALAAVTAKDLPGYSRMTVSAAFEDYLAKNPDVAEKLKQNPELSRMGMGRAVLQQQLISGKTTIRLMERHYFPHTPHTMQNATPQDGWGEKEERDYHPFANATPNSSAQILLDRAVGAMRSDKARQRAAAQINRDLSGAAGNASSAAAEITDITEIGRAHV